MPVTTPVTAALTSVDRLRARLAEELRELDEAGLRRRLTTIEALDGPLAQIGGRQVVCWCSNDYLGLSVHPALAAAAAEAGARFGIGGRASRLLAGTTAVHTRLEGSLAVWFGTEAALVYPSGYHANLGTLGALLAKGDAVFVDRLAHASLLDAARASGARLRVFRHHDVDQVRALLARAHGARRRMVVTEGIFSMDGDTPPLRELVDAAEQHGAVVYLDDAHGTFVTGSTGRGTPEASGVPIERLIYMGTLGKALGCQGGFVAGSHTLIDLLRNRARTFLYTTALAAPVAAAAEAGLTLLGREPQHRQQLHERVRRLTGGLAAIPGCATAGSHIAPIIVGSARRAVTLAESLWDQGLWAPAIRPPTVPNGASRIRVSVTARHSTAQVDELCGALRAALQACP